MGIAGGNYAPHNSRGLAYVYGTDCTGRQVLQYKYQIDSPLTPEEQAELDEWNALQADKCNYEAWMRGSLEADTGRAIAYIESTN